MTARSILLGLLACLACVAPVHADDPGTDNDPWAGFNRAIFKFNDTLDVYAIEPAAKGWDFVVPKRVQTCLTNFFENLASPKVVVNDVLQGKMHDAASDVARFMVNTTFGLAGFFDVASVWKLEQHDEDFGQTLGVWGVPPGPYLVLPFFGPSDPRDTVGLGADSATGIYWYFLEIEYTAGIRAISTVNGRADILDTVRDVKEASVDYYAAVRNGFLQRRQALVEDRRELSKSQQEDLYTIEE